MRRLLALLSIAAGYGACAQPVPITMPGVRYVVPAPVIETVHPPVPALPPAPVEAPRPAALTTCDPGGCWDSRGKRLDSVGPLLVGPRGACDVQGGVVLCPQ